MPKFKPKCPDCGSILEKAYRGYSCPNAECKVIKVHFDRSILSEEADLVHGVVVPVDGGFQAYSGV